MTLITKLLANCLVLFILMGISPATAQNQSDDAFEVMSYNIRYDNPDDGINRWELRKDRVANLIRYHNPSFLGIQEALPHQLKQLQQELPQMNWIGQGRDGGENGEYSALFYNRQRFQLVPGSDSTMWLSETPDRPSKSWDAALPRIVTWGKFVDQRTGRRLYVFNTHFDHLGDTAREKSAQLIVDTINEVSEGLPVVLTGDFNAIPGSKPYLILNSGDSPLSDAFHTARQPHLGPLYTYTGFNVMGDGANRRIDFIFTTNKFEVLKHQVISTFREGRYPSDHLPVSAVVRFSGS
ncbi:MAG: endonuclease/exonuclease/phosphatase family protein [Balneolaceae bacterium]|nr:endonuclease/exonuclease/phosphatase family protein [Balneolaceae bacterium]